MIGRAARVRGGRSTAADAPLCGPATNGYFVKTRVPEQPVKLELKVDSDPANLAPIRKATEAFAARFGLEPQAVADLGLCVNEAVANVIRHAYGGRTDRPIAVTCEGSTAGVRVLIRDWGNGVDPSSIPARAYDPLTPGGVGLICLTRLLDDVTYTPQRDGGMLTTLVKKRKKF
jgi:anti-sigma regulatory factor (Ser/Thr protein kinase)